jgi:hypothetical protein
VEVKEILTSKEQKDSKSRISKIDNVKNRYNFSENIKPVEMQEKTISIASIPPCDTIIIRSIEPRIIRCNSNPTLVIININSCFF